MAQRLKPETKTLRYMINGMGMIAAQASRRVRKFSFDLFGFVDVVGFKPILGLPATAGACPEFTPMEALTDVCQHCRCRRAEHAIDPREVASWLCVQATSSDNQAARMKKILESELLRARAYALVSSGHRVEVWGWVRGRHAGAEAFRRFELRGGSPAGLVWHDKGITEVDGELLVQAPR